MRYYNEPKMLCLPWNFTSRDFDALPSGAQYEYLNPDKFLDWDYVDSYWSKPEILLSFSAIMNEKPDGDAHGSSSDSVSLDAEYQLYCITSVLGQLTALYNYYYGILSDIYREKSRLINFWIKNRKALMSAHSPTSEQVHAHTDFLNLYYDGCLDLYHHFWDAFPGSEFHDMRSFLAGVRSFFHRVLHEPTEMEAVAILERLGSCIQRIDNQTINTDEFHIKSWWTWNEVESIWENLQNAANTLCAKISAHSNRNYPLFLVIRQDITDLKEITKQLLENTAPLKGLTKPLKSFNSYKKYLETGRKCVARAIFKDKTYVAFSGYEDTDDSLVTKIWDVDQTADLLSFFKILCDAENVTLAYLSSKVVSRIMWYEYGIARGPMRKEIQEEKHRLSFSSPPTPKKAIPGIIRNNIEIKYSCCERKILTQIALDYQRNEINGHNGTIYVKLSPCRRCEGALRDWERNYISEWDVHYLIDYPKK